MAKLLLTGANVAKRSRRADEREELESSATYRSALSVLCRCQQQSHGPWRAHRAATRGAHTHANQELTHNAHIRTSSTPPSDLHSAAATQSTEHASGLPISLGCKDDASGEVKFDGR